MLTILENLLLCLIHNPFTKVTQPHAKMCKTLTSVIKEAKKYIYNNQIINFNNKMKTIWNIIKAETNRLKGPITTTTI